MIAKAGTDLIDVDQWIADHGYWEPIPGYDLDDWRYEIANDATRQGYHDWVRNRQEQLEHGEEL